LSKTNIPEWLNVLLWFVIYGFILFKVYNWVDNYNPSKKKIIFEEIQEREWKRSVELQIQENDKLDQNIELEAQRLFSEFLAAPVIGAKGYEFKNYIPLINPVKLSSLIYNEEAYKYKNQDLQKLVFKRYKELIKESGLDKL
jgi:hypothetical protein